MGKTLGTITTVLGTLLTALTAWFLVQGLILNGTVPPVWQSLGAVGGFLAGVAMLAWGTEQYIRGRRDGGRVTPPQGQL